MDERGQDVEPRKMLGFFWADIEERDRVVAQPAHVLPGEDA